MSEDPNGQLKAITDEEWKDIMLRLYAYAGYKCRLLPRHMKPEDMALEAVQLVFTGERKWNPEKDPKIFDFLKGVVDSRWWNLRRKGDLQRFTSNEALLDKAMEDLSVEQYENNTALTVNGTEYGHEIDQRLQLIQAAVEGDSELEDFYLALEYGCSSIKEIASMLDWTASKTYKVKAKLTNKLKDKETEKVAQHG